MQAKKGELQKVTDKSGHYHPGAAETCQALEELKTNGVPLSSFALSIESIPSDDPETKFNAEYKSARDFAEKVGRARKGSCRDRPCSGTFDAMFRWPRRRAVVETTRVGRYELRVEVVRVGTRSEGRIGRLYCDDREIRGIRPGGTVVVDPGSPVFVYVGDDREHLWSVSGWTVEPPGSR